jgi:hypothetical protein
VALANLESEIIGINTTTTPVDSPNEYIPLNEELWRETIRNPTSMSVEKTIQKVIQVIKRDSATQDYTRSTLTLAQVEVAVEEPGNESPVSIPTKITTTSQISVDPNLGTIYLKGSNNVTETIRIVDVTETFAVPPYTCIEAYFIMGTEKAKQQNITAHLRVSAKVSRFGSAAGVITHSQWAPGLVVEQLMKEKCFIGKYVETRAYDVSYEITGKLETSVGIHTSFIAHQIDCTN